MYLIIDNMQVAVFIAPKEFKDETLSKVLPLFQKWGVEPVITSYSQKDCIGSHGAAYKPKIHTSKLEADEFAGMFLIDGPGIDAFKLYEHRPLLNLIKAFTEKGKPVAAVGNAVKILARANVITNEKVAETKDDDTERLVKLFKGEISAEPIETSTNILTSSSSDNSEELADAMIGKLGVK